jgi:hypothetical protein
MTDPQPHAAAPPGGTIEPPEGLLPLHTVYRDIYSANNNWLAEIMTPDFTVDEDDAIARYLVEAANAYPALARALAERGGRPGKGGEAYGRVVRTRRSGRGG